MKERDVKLVIGETNWEAFLKWMRNQTVGLYPDSSTDYYEDDVIAFKKKLETGHDRQKDLFAWD